METINNQSELPIGWTFAKLGQLVSVSKEKFNPIKSKNEIFIGLEHIEPHTGRIIGTGRSSEIRSTKTVFHSEDILYGRLRPYLNKVCVPNFNGVCSTDIIVFAKNNFLDTKYIARYLSTGRFVRFASQNMSGVQHPRISHDVISQYFIPLPPLQEQHRIVSKLEELFTKLDAGIDTLKGTKLLLKRYRRSVLKHAFEGKLTQKWRQTYKKEMEAGAEIVSRINKNRKNNDNGYLLPMQSSFLYNIPQEWAWTRTGDICRGIVPGRYKPKEFNGSIPWITLPDVNDLRISRSLKNMCVSEDAAYEVGMKIMPKDTILMSCIGEFGIICITDCPVVPNQQFHGFICEDSIVPEFVAYALMGQTEQMKKLSSSTTIAYMNKTKCNSICIPIASMKEQYKIIEEIEHQFSILNNNEYVIELCHRYAHRLRKSILNDAFEGKLVPQDISDESASALLTKIKQKLKDKNKDSLDSKQTRLM